MKLLHHTVFNLRKHQTTKLYNIRPFRCRHSTTNIPTSVPPSVIYSRLVSEGRVREDTHQVVALQHLDNLHNELIPYSQRKDKQLVEPKGNRILQLFNMFGANDPFSNKQSAPKSFYFW